MLGITGVGFTVTVTVKFEPIQDPATPDVGITVYTAFNALLVGFTKVPVIVEDEIPAIPPVIPPFICGIPQEYVVPTGTITDDVGEPLIGVVLNKLLLHALTVKLDITGLGFTVTINVNGFPAQAPAAPDTVETI